MATATFIEIKNMSMLNLYSTSSSIPSTVFKTNPQYMVSVIATLDKEANFLAGVLRIGRGQGMLDHASECDFVGAFIHKITVGLDRDGLILR